MSNRGNPAGQVEASSLSTVGQIPMNIWYKRYLISGANAEKGDGKLGLGVSITQVITLRSE